MARGKNFVDTYTSDIVLCILSLLDDPADIVRASLVSRSWRNFTTAFLKSCLRKAPTLTNITSTAEKTDVALIVYLNTMSWEVLEREHKMYTSFLHALSNSTISPMECIECVIGASSTNRHVEESVFHVLQKGTFPYWSSNGQSDPNAPESIIINLKSRVCIVNEIDIQHSRVYTETGSPVYSAKFVRFRMGHPRSSTDFKVNVKSLPQQQLEDKYIWTYTSPEFPMTQESYLQSFKLPEPVVCVGGYLQIELLGRAQRNESDGLYYLCAGEVRVLGHPLSPAFDVEMGLPGDFCLINCPAAVNSVFKRISQVEEDSDESIFDDFEIGNLIDIIDIPGEDPGDLDFEFNLQNFGLF